MPSMLDAVVCKVRKRIRIQPRKCQSRAFHSSASTLADGGISNPRASRGHGKHLQHRNPQISDGPINHERRTGKAFVTRSSRTCGTPTRCKCAALSARSSAPNRHCRWCVNSPRHRPAGAVQTRFVFRLQDVTQLHASVVHFVSPSRKAECQVTKWETANTSVNSRDARPVCAKNTVHSNPQTLSWLREGKAYGVHMRNSEACCLSHPASTANQAPTALPSTMQMRPLLHTQTPPRLRKPNDRISTQVLNPSSAS